MCIHKCLISRKTLPSIKKQKENYNKNVRVSQILEEIYIIIVIKINKIHSSNNKYLFFNFKPYNFTKMIIISVEIYLYLYECVLLYVP